MQVPVDTIFIGIWHADMLTCSTLERDTEEMQDACEQ